MVVDAGPDFRQQMLRAGVERLDAVLITHEHNDHLIGLDDVRPFNYLQQRHLPIYAVPRVQQEIRTRFAYIFDADPYPGAPQLTLKPIDKDKPIRIGDLSIQPIEVLHGELPVLGFRFGAFTYLTDVKSIAPEELKKVVGSQVLVINALHHKPHPTHLNLREAIKLVQQLGVPEVWLTHVSHQMGLYTDVSKDLPPPVHLATDMLQLRIEAE